MSITINSLPRMQQAEAKEATQKQNDIFANEGIENIVSKTGQLNFFFSTILPAERSAEFEEASLEDKSKFYLVGTLAQLDTTKEFLEAWEEQYNIIFA
jgi:hypothetical protein